MNKSVVLILLVAVVNAAHYKHGHAHHKIDDDNRKLRDGANPDEDDYRNFCSRISSFQPQKAQSELTEVLQRLQDDGLLPTSNPNKKAEEICEHPGNYSSRVCSYFRKYEMINSILLDYNMVTTESDVRPFYLRMWCKHPECLEFKARNCKIVSHRNEGLPGYVGCTGLHVAALDPKTSIQLREEVTKICKVDKYAGPFCLSDKMIGIVDRCSRKDEMKSFLDADQFNNAILLNYAALKSVDPENFAEVQPSNQKEQELYSGNLQVIFDLFNQAKYAELAKYMELLPGSIDIVPSCTSMATAGFDESKQRECILGRTIDQVKQFLQLLPENKPSLGGEERKILNTKIDYKEYLKQGQIERILDVVQNQELTIFTITDNLKKQFDKSVGERFQEMKTYFSQVEGFNKEIAKADIGYISGTLNTYETSIENLAREVATGLSDLLLYAIGTSSADLIQKTAVLAMQIADACNPLKTLFGGGAATDVLGAADELALAIANVAKSAKLQSSFGELIDKTEKIMNKFDDNSEFLRTVKELLKKIDAEETSDSSFEDNKITFIEKYNAYTPGVTKPELTEMTATWETVLDEACNVIDGAETTGAAAIKAIVDGLGLCWKVKIKAQKMIETYCEIYDFQFDLMDALAAYVRSATAVNAASDMNENYAQVAQSNPDDILYFLQQLAGLSFIMNKIQMMQTVEAYCDVLEYKEGAVRPSVCRGLDTDVKGLIAHVEKECSSKTLQYRNVPMTPAKSGDKAFLNITELFAGRPVTFQIPDGQWLVDNEWINEDEKSAAIYLRKFEVFLPTESQTSRDIQVVTKITGGNYLTDDKTEYLITPPRPLVFDYAEGRDTVCRQESIRNPYTLCATDAPAEICPHSPETDCVEVPTTVLYGSIFAQLSVRLRGYPSSLPIPDPATQASVKVGVQLCKMSDLVKDATVSHTKKPGVAKKHWSKKLRKDSSSRRCCGDGQYWNEKEGSCQSCPNGSVRRLHGYFCDNNHKTLSS
ncbi:uncharacterized protein LOC114515691 [Dendronephthya gigantea]|uniref:uncharacterized protein LOC114515691 n=1 Tax=Dendronephthya gigantea TaxID=151771 RepID=UPI00106C3C18|nr:uncharacterized protein LOC114515691 [Dendronephthya gigantea]